MALGVRRDLSLVFFWTLFIVQIFQNESLTLWPVQSCPGNQSEVEAATIRLNCSDVKESINVYHCLPLSNLSMLAEFCYDGLSGLIEAGNCMVLYRDTLNNFPCGHFTSGCPNAHYFPKHMYNYPACLKINNSCYIADPSCSNERFLETTSQSSVKVEATTITNNKSLTVQTAINRNDKSLLQYVIPIVLGLLFPPITIALIILWSRRWCESNREDRDEEQELLSREPPSLKTDLTINILEHSVILVCEVIGSQRSHPLTEIFWTKDNVKIDIPINGGKYIGGSLANPSLQINEVNETDVGVYQCSATNATGTVYSEITHLELPVLTLQGVSSGGDEVIISYSFVKEGFPKAQNMRWTKNGNPLDRNTGKYSGGDLETKCLKIHSPTEDDLGEYGCEVSSILGSVKDCLSLSLPSLRIYQETNISKESVRLVCDIFVSRTSPKVTDVIWTKDNIKIDISSSRGKYIVGSLGDYSLEIKKVDQHDAGAYQCCATNAAGTKCSEIIQLGPPAILITKREDEENRRVIYEAKIESLPVALRAKWKVKINDEFQPIDVHDLAYKGSTVSLPNPRLIVNKSKTNQFGSFQIEVQNFIDTAIQQTNDEQLEADGGFLLKSDKDDSMKEMHTYLEDKDFLERYQKYLEEGSVEVCPISQLIIVGEHGVGKTTLLYRLQGRSRDEIDAIKSTRGVECHTEQHSFIITRNQLEMNVRGVSSLSVDPGHVSTFSKDTDRQRENDEKTKHDKQGIQDKEPKQDKQTNNNTEPKDDKQAEDDTERKQGIQTEQDLEPNHDKQTEQDTDPLHDKQTEQDTKLKQDKETERDIEPEHAEFDTKILTDMLEKELKDKNNLFGKKDDVVLDVLDFAGQGEYYASHQTYIRKDAIFILVVDTSKNINQRTELEERDENKSIPETVDERTPLFLCDRPGVAFKCWSPKDYFYYWLKTIQIHGGSSERIIFIGTHQDHKRKDFNFVHLLNDAMKENLVTEAFSKPIITDLERYDEATEDTLTEIKNEICILINKCRRENQPAKWVKFASMFNIIRRKFPISKIEKILQIIDNFDLGMSDTEVADMLHFFHRSGKIIFFNTDRLNEIIILDISWFNNCFKHIIADREHVEEDCRIVDVKDQKMLCNFHDKGVLEIGLYKKLLSQKGISEQYQNILGEYQSKLGMMFYIQNYKINDGSSIDGWYVPSINTQEFKPINVRYKSKESSPILCFKFKDFLPFDFFGRLIVACVSSGYWHPYDFRLCKTGADMCYRTSGDEGEQIYLFTSRGIVTVQFIGKHSEKHGPKVRQEIIRIIGQICQFYGSTTDYELGFLCQKKEGYKENSVNHFVSKRSKFCLECSEPYDWVDAESFWKEGTDEEHTSRETKARRKTDPVQIACTVYSHVVKRVTEIAADTPQALCSKLNSAWLDDLADIGQKLYDLREKSEAKDEKTETDLRNINRDLKMVSCDLDKYCRNIRKEIFFLWTQTEDFSERNEGCV